MKNRRIMAHLWGVKLASLLWKTPIVLLRWDFEIALML